MSPKLLDAWAQFFSSEENVVIVQDDITTVSCDAVVSPANSFGFMDGGLDHALSQRFGSNLQEDLRQKIKELPEGELLVGQAMLIDTGDKDIPFLISAPTMRVPMNFNIDTSVNAYLAMKAILIKAKSDDRISTVAIPGLCTGAGGMDTVIASGQMYYAYKEVILGHKMNFSSFGEAQKYHLEINPKGLIYK